jgi:hypothetical protein
MLTDTDSFCYHIKETDIFEIIKNNMDEFDLSDYPKDHELYNPKNKKVMGKFKNVSIEQIKEFLGLRSKMYSYKIDGETKYKNICKGIKKKLLSLILKLKIMLIHYIPMNLLIFIKMVLDLMNMNYIQKHNIKKLFHAMMIRFIFVMIILIHIPSVIIKLSKLL